METQKDNYAVGKQKMIGLMVNVEDQKVSQVIAALTYLGVKVVPLKGWESLPIVG